MMAWVRRTAALLAGFLLCGRFLTRGAWIAAALSLTVAAVWSLDSFFSVRIRKAANSALLLADVLLVGWAALAGVFTWWLVPAVSLGLICWNAGVFLAEWKESPARSRMRYMRLLALSAGVGTVAGVSAALLGSIITIGFAVTFFLMIVSGVSLLKTLGARR